MNLIDVINDAWAWKGFTPLKVLEVNSFGNVLLKDAAGRYWRICPEELSCEMVAESEQRFNGLLSDPKFKSDWEMPALVSIAQEKLGGLKPGYCYCLKTPATLGGAYEADNMAAIPLMEAIGLSGDIAQQIKDLPEGTKVKIRLVD